MGATRRRLLLPAVALTLVAPAVPTVAATPDLLPVSAPARAGSASAAALPGCAAADHPGGDWAYYGADRSNTRSQPAESVITPTRVPTLAPAFRFSARDGGGRGDFTGNPVVVDGCLYVASTGGWVFALNADTGEKVWATELPAGSRVYGSAAVSGGRVYLGVSRSNSPYAAALDQATGALLWQTQIDEQEGSDVYGGPVIFDGIMGIGVSGGAAELDEEETRYAFQGSFVLLETQDDPQRGRVAGTILRKTWTVHGPEIEDGYAGATIWSTPAIDPESKTGWVGTGNPFQPEKEHAHANAIVKLDFDRESETFGQIVGSYKGDVDEYIPLDAPCTDLPGNPPPYYPQGLGGCMQLDLDFGSSPNLMRDADGRLLVGVGQKSGVYHVMDAETMEPVWKQIVGFPSAVGGIVGSTAVANGAVYGPITVAGYLWSLDQRTGLHRWVSPIADGAHWGNPVAVANGIVYTVTTTGLLNAYEATTGALLLSRPMALDVAPGDPPISWGAVSVARNTVYATVGMSALPNGYVIAYRPDTSLPVPDQVPGVPDPLPGPGGGAGPQVLSGPQAQFYGYATPAVVAPDGRPVTYTTADLVKHDVVQDPRTDGVAGDGSAPWCDRFPAGKCPLFWTELLGLGESAPVQGLDGLASGVYSFYCTLHPGMRGRLVKP